MKTSTGIVVYKNTANRQLLFLLVHPGGPFWKNKDEGAWSIPKGEYTAGEDPLTVAKREFTEETGNVLPADAQYITLQPVKTKSGKIITAFATNADFDQCFISSNTFEIEWPPKSGKMLQIPETDKAQWFTPAEALIKINAGQATILEQLREILIS